MEHIIEPQKQLTVLAKVDVVVAGGGPAGVAAAIAAARNGAQVLLVEEANYVGGLMTAMPILSFYSYQGKQIIFGIAQELVDRLVERGASPGHVPDPRLGSVTVADVEELKIVAQDMIEEAGVRVLLRTLVAAPVVEERTVKGVIVESKSGRQAILAAVTIDCTGDGDVAARAGATYEIKEREAIQPGTLMFRMAHVDVDRLRLALAENPEHAYMVQGIGAGPEHYLKAKRFALDGFRDLVQEARDRGDLPPDYPQRWAIIATGAPEDEVYVNMAMATNFYSIDALDLTRAEMEARKRVRIAANFLIKYVPGFEQARVIASHNCIGVRESRRIMGDYVLAAEDIMQSRRFDDGVAVAPWRPSRGHHPKGEFVDDPFREKYPTDAVRGCEVPYRCLLPRGLEGILVAGRPISATGEGQNAIRVMAACMALGQAAGTAAAMAAKGAITPREVDGPTLRATLMAQGVRFAGAS